jgi:pyruvate-formate lyase
MLFRQRGAGPSTSPGRENSTRNSFSALFRTYACLGGMTLQLNCVSVNQLKNAQLHPEFHQGLVVRISGLSAKFIALSSVFKMKS